MGRILIISSTVLACMQLASLCVGYDDRPPIQTEKSTIPIESVASTVPVLKSASRFIGEWRSQDVQGPQQVDVRSRPANRLEANQFNSNDAWLPLNLSQASTQPLKPLKESVVTIERSAADNSHRKSKVAAGDEWMAQEASKSEGNAKTSAIDASRAWHESDEDERHLDHPQRPVKVSNSEGRPALNETAINSSPYPRNSTPLRPVDSVETRKPTDSPFVDIGGSFRGGGGSVPFETHAVRPVVTTTPEQNDEIVPKETKPDRNVSLAGWDPDLVAMQKAPPKPPEIFSETSTQAPTEDEDSQEGEDKPLGEAPQDLGQLFQSQSAILLSPGEAQLDIGFSYASEQARRVVILPAGNAIALQRVRARRFILPVNLRYGVHERMEIFGSVPFGIAHTEVSDPVTIASDTRGGIGDAQFGALFELHRQDLDYPDVTASISVSAPTGAEPFSLTNTPANLGNGFWRALANINVVKTYDPVVVFGGIGYAHEFATNHLGVRFQPGEIFNYSFGMGFAINDEIAVSTSLSGSYQGKLDVAGRKIPNSAIEPIAIRLSLTKRTSRTSRIQPFIDFGVTDDANDIFFGVFFIRNYRNHH